MTTAADKWFIRECALCIPGTWIDKYDNWFRFVCAVKSVFSGPDGLELAIEVSKRAPRFPSAQGTVELWQTVSPAGKIGAGSIIHWAQETNPAAFAAVCKLRASKFPVCYD